MGKHDVEEIRLLPLENKYGDWPRSGEIDLVQAAGNEDLKCGSALKGHQEVRSALHFGPDRENDFYDKTFMEK